MQNWTQSRWEATGRLEADAARSRFAVRTVEAAADV
jgi:hypothetical protein